MSVLLDNTWVSTDSNVAKAQVKLNDEGKLFTNVVAATLVVVVTKTDSTTISAESWKICEPGDKVVFSVDEITALIPIGITVAETIAAVTVEACKTVTLALTQTSAAEE